MERSQVTRCRGNLTRRKKGKQPRADGFEEACGHKRSNQHSLSRLEEVGEEKDYSSPGNCLGLDERRTHHGGGPS